MQFSVLDDIANPNVYNKFQIYQIKQCQFTVYPIFMIFDEACVYINFGNPTVSKRYI